jgi:adenine-specific DNA methylase
MIPKDCKRLAEVDFTIAVVSTHAAREKSIRHVHPSTLHLWWARRPLASSRAVLLALLLPDPGDPLCPAGFKTEARALLPRVGCGTGETDSALRRGLLKFIGDFANWDLAAQATYLEVARALVRAAHPDETPLVVDPFAGGGPSRWRPCAWGARRSPAISSRSGKGRACFCPPSPSDVLGFC